MMNKTIRCLTILIIVASSQMVAGESFTEGANTYTTEHSANTPKFVKEDFPFNVSTGVSMNAVESVSAIGVNAASADGLYTYGGSSQGGAVGKCGDKRDDFNSPLAAGTPEATNGCGAEGTEEE